MIVSEVQIACEYKKLFRRKVIVYLKLMLHANGIWEMAINTKYFKDKVTGKLWRNIEKYCKSSIVAAQNRELAKIFQIGHKTKHYYSNSTSRYSKLNRMQVTYKECISFVDNYQIFMGTDK